MRIEELYEKKFGKLLPKETPSLEAKDAEKRRLNAQRKLEKGKEEGKDLTNGST